MIDDEQKTNKLLEKLRVELPIKAYPKKEFTKMMKKSGDLRNEKRELEIESVMYGGDEGGILCSIKPWESSKQAYVVSLTHLKIPREHPLENDIREYQEHRTLKILLREGKVIRGVKRRKKKGFGK